MNKYLIRFIIRLRKHFVQKEEYRSEMKRIILTLQVTLFGLLAAFIFLGVDSFFSFAELNVLVDVSTILLFLLSLILLSKGYFDSSKYIIIVITSFALTVNSSTSGREAGNQFIWFPVLCAPFIFFTLKNFPKILICIFLSLLFLTFLEITDYKILYNNSYSIEYIRINYYICYFVSIILVCFYVYYLVRANNDSEKKLKKLNKTLKLNNENLKKTNNELDSFVYKASHDMRAPLTSMLGLIEIMKKENDLTIIREYVSLKERSIKKLDSYIVDILNISRNARVEVNIAQVDIRSMIDEVFMQLSYIENFTRTNKIINISQATPFYTDEKRLYIIFSNLISNSIRYADLSKSNPYIEIKINVYIHEVIIKIKDNGIGIPEEHLKKVFDMFYRATDKTSGSGLGLYIVKETISKLKGKIEVKSEGGKWTEFIMEIPNYSKTL